MAKVTLTIADREVDQVVRAVKRLEEQVRREVNRLIDKYCDLILSEAAATAPEDTGRLRKSIRKELGDLAGTVFADRKTAYYAPFVEHGTSRTAARPFMRPAYERYKGPFVEELRRMIGS